MDADLSSLPDDIDALKAALIAARTEAAAEKACAVAAVVSYYGLERPFLRLRGRFRD